MAAAMKSAPKSSKKTTAMKSASMKTTSMKTTGMKKAVSMKAVMKKTVMKASAMKNKAMKKSVMKSIMKKKKAMKKTLKKSRANVMAGKLEKTSGGLKASQLTRNAANKIVSKKARATALKRPSMQKIMQWKDSVAKARANLKIKGFVPCGGETAAGKALYKATRVIYDKLK